MLSATTKTLLALAALSSLALATACEETQTCVSTNCAVGTDCLRTECTNSNEECANTCSVSWLDAAAQPFVKSCAQI